MNRRSMMNLQHNEAIAAPGRDAIVTSLEALYHGRQPRQFDNPCPLHAGGEDPLESVCVWRRAEPVPHWHYLTLGLSELYAKQGKNPLVSGFGFELTFRLALEPGATEPPAWPMHLLQSLARYVFQSGHGFHDGHRLSTNGPITLGSPTHLCALGFAFDPELTAIDTPNGHLAFLQVIGLTMDEERAAQQWETRKLLDLLRPVMPLWVTDLRRASLLSAPAVQAQVSDAIRKEGSSCVAVYADALKVALHKRLLRKSTAEVTLGARQIAQLAELLPLRLPFGRPFLLAGPGWKLQFHIAERNAWRIEQGVLTLCLTPSGVQEFAALLPARQGIYQLPSLHHIRWNVQQTMIRNAQGDVVELIG